MDCVRYDPRVITLFEELGSKRSSHPSARLKVTTYPEEWKHCMTIRVFEGREVICFSREIAYKSLLDEIITSRVVSEETVQKYNEINGMNKKYGF